MKGILYISSHNTGYGHVSITTAITQELKKIDASIEINDLDAFKLSGKVNIKMSNLYNSIAVNVPLFWKLCYEFGNIFPSIVRFFTSKNLKTGLLKQIDELEPNLIVVTHPAFVSAVLDTVHKRGIKIPVVVMIADLDNVSKLWADSRTSYTLCPSVNAKRTMLEMGIPEQKLKVFGFPTREAFNKSIETCKISDNVIVANKIPTFLLMNGSQGVGYAKKIAEKLLQSMDCKVIILAGKNEELKQSLEKALLPVYDGRVTITGFTDKVEYYMSISDVLILRASPNVLMEAVNLCKPVIVTGALTGQEEKNPQFVEDNSLGVVCKDIDKLPQTVKRLFENNGEKLNQIIEYQKAFRQPDAAKKTAEFLMGLLNIN